MQRRTFLQSMAGTACAAPATSRPNIVVIMADDMGFSDIGCYGGEIATPNIDRLARGGVRFRQFYNTARCCPTRASLLTGLYAHQAGIGHMVDTGSRLPSYTGDLKPNCVTIPQVLKSAGYKTAMSGKWHVTPVTESKHNWPRQRGFDHFYGTIHGAGSFYDPVTLTRDNTPIEPEGKDYYYTDAITDNAISYLDKIGRGPDPFFLYAAYTAPHWPMHALEADIAKYKGRYKDGWDALRAERRERQIRLGLIDKKWPLTARDSRVPDWASAPDKDWEQRRMEVYAAMVDRLDQNVGRLMAKLRETAAEQNTLVLFLADNGGCAEELFKNSGARHFPKATRDGRPVRFGNFPNIMPGADDTYQSYGIGWANASNTPFRLYKHWVHEGGISSPLIASWPGRIRNPGSLTGQHGHLVDIMATCVDVGGATYPATHDGQSILPAEGRSLVPVFRGDKRQAPVYYWEHEGNRAVREDRWKLVSKFPDAWELYDIRADRVERNNLAARHPDHVRRMSSMYDAWAARCGVEPWDAVRKKT
jgi:arylsulfatase